MNWEALTDWRQLLVWPGPDTEPAVWVTQVFAVVLCTVSVNFVLMRVIDIVDHFSRETHNLWDDALLDSLRIPVRLLIWVAGLSVAAEMMQAVSEAAVFDYVGDVRRVAFILIVALFLTKLVGNVEKNLIDPDRMRKNLDANKRKLAEKTKAAEALQKSYNQSKAENARLEQRVKELEAQQAEANTDEEVQDDSGNQAAA